MKNALLISVIFLVACGSKTAEDTPSIAQALSISEVNVRTHCYQRILYFAVWNNNPSIAPYLTGAVIDPSTLQAQRC